MRYRLTILLTLFTLLCPAASDITSLRFSRITAEEGLCDNQVQHIMQLPDGRMLFTTFGNINIYDGVQFSHIHHSGIAPYLLRGYHGAYHVYVDRHQRVWIKNNQSLLCFDLSHNAYVPSPDRMLKQLARTDETVTDLFVDSGHELWIVLHRKLWCGRTGKTIVMPVAWGELQDVDVCGTVGYLFFHTGLVAAVNLLSNRVLYTAAAYPAAEAHRYVQTSMVVQAPGGRFYQIRNGTEGVFLCFDTHSRRWQTLLTTDYLLHTLAVKDEGTLYFTSARGLWRYDVKNRHTALQRGLTLADGIVTQAAANTIFFDRQGGIWVGTYRSGLLYAHPSRFPFHTRAEHNVRWPEVRRQLKDSRGRMWIATADGLQLKWGKRKKMIYSEDGLSNDYICGLAEDLDGRLWVSTAKGISCVEAHSWNDIKVSAYGVADGVLSGGYTEGKATATADGRVMMGGDNGTTVFVPAEVKRMDSLVLHPRLIRLTVGGALYPTGDVRPSLAHDENLLTLSFSALNYALPQHTCYRYTLSSDDGSATVVTKPGQPNGEVDRQGALHLTLMNLKPGDYTISVEASVNGVLWQGTPATFSFKIRPPWWNTGWAYALYALLAVALATLGFTLYTRAQRREMYRKLKEERLMARIKSLVD